MAVIFASTVSVGLQADWAIKNTAQFMPSEMVWIERIFALCFAVELALRFLAEGMKLFSPRNRELGWNLLDVFLVAFSIFDQVLTAVVVVSSPDMSIVRTLRVFRLV